MSTSLLLKEIAREQRRAGEEVEPPATAATIAEADGFLRRRFRMTLPPVLAALRVIRGGVDFNGLVVYRASTHPTPRCRASLAEVNAMPGGAAGDERLRVGERGMEAFLRDRNDGGWHRANRVSLDSFERFSPCEALILAVLRKYLAA